MQIPATSGNSVKNNNLGWYCLVATIAASDHRICVKTFTSARGASVGTIFNIIHTDLGLVKKSARWVPEMLSQEQQEDLGWKVGQDHHDQYYHHHRLCCVHENTLEIQINSRQDAQKVYTQAPSRTKLLPTRPSRLCSHTMATRE